jgi:pimeloyl-[acyl-carrier protein] methyl ester esterase
MTTSAPKLVLLPGLDGTGDLFNEFIVALPSGFQAITVRYPTTRSLSYAQLVPLVRDATPTSDPFVLVAESFSTPLAIQIGAEGPPNMKALVLCAGFATSPVRGWRRFLASALAPILFRLPLPAFLAKRVLAGWDAPIEFVRAVRTAISSVTATVLTDRLRSVFSCDVRTALRKVRIPILYLRARQDELVGAASLEKIRQIQPNITVADIDGPHLLLQRRPIEAFTVIENFLRQLK